MSEQSVITLTEAAANRVKEIVTTAANNIAGVRIVVKEGGCAGYSYSMEYAAAKNPNDEVIIPAPFWVSYPDIVLLAEGRPIIVQCNSKQETNMNYRLMRDRGWFATRLIYCIH